MVDCEAKRAASEPSKLAIPRVEGEMFTKSTPLLQMHIVCLPGCCFAAVSPLMKKVLKR